jgi:signal transduction histidine kinase
MTEKPELVSLFSFGINLLFLLLSAVYFYQTDFSLFRLLIFPMYLLLILCLFFEFMAKKENVFITFSVVHLLILLIIFKSIGLRNPLFNITLSFFLFLNIAMRLHFLQAVALNLIILILLSFAITQYENSQIFSSLYFFFLGAVLMVFSQMISYYREALIKSRNYEEEKDRSIDKLEAVSESLLQHLTEIREESAEKERYRITRELHDSLGYSMTNIVSIMNAAQYLFEEDPERVKNYCIKTRDMATETMEETRRTLYKLRDITRDIPSNPAFFFDKMCREFQEATGIITHCEGGNFTNPPAERIFSTVYRIVQVGFINALKHGETETIKLYFWVDDNELRMTIWNNINKIIPPSRLEEGIGLKGVRERLDVLDGSLSITQNLDGFSLNITIPVDEE